jgi:hypothetical protein
MFQLFYSFLIPYYRTFSQVLVSWLYCFNTRAGLPPNHNIWYIFRNNTSGRHYAMSTYSYSIITEFSYPNIIFNNSYIGRDLDLLWVYLLRNYESCNLCTAAYYNIISLVTGPTNFTLEVILL